MIRIVESTQYFDDDNGLEFMFNPVEDSVELIETKEGFLLKYLTVDQNPMRPDEWDDDCRFLLFYHNSFTVEDDRVNKNDLVDMYRDDLPEEEKQEHYLNDYHIFWVSALIHSGVWLSLEKSFASDPQGWDTSLAGAVLVKKDLIEDKEQARKSAQGLIDEWNCYLQGDVYCCVCEKLDKSKEHVDYDIVGGYIGLKYAMEALKTEF